MWRRCRLKKSVQTELYENTFDPHHPAFDEVWGFAMFLSRLRAEPETCFRQYAKKYLRRDKIDDLRAVLTACAPEGPDGKLYRLIAVATFSPI